MPLLDKQRTFGSSNVCRAHNGADGIVCPMGHCLPAAAAEVRGGRVHVGTSTTSQDHLRLATETFITFVYAAAIHIILHTAHESRFGASLATSLVLLLVVTFILADWLSRTRLPWLIPEPVTPLRQLVKTVLELLCLYLILFAALTYLDGSRSGDADATTTLFVYITCFLGATFLWNLQMFKIMEQLSWWQLFGASFTGGAGELDGAKAYAQRYENYRTRVLAKPTPRDGKFRPLHAFHGSVVVVTGYVVPQLVALHLSLGNIFLGLTLVVHTIMHDSKPLLSYSPSWVLGLFDALRVFSGSAAVTLFCCSLVIGTLASVQHSRTDKFWRWLLVFGSVSLAAVWIIVPARGVAIFISRVTFALLLPCILFVLAGDRFEFGIPARVRFALQCGASTLLVLEYAFLLAACPPALLPAIVVCQHLGINLFLQYAATPIATIRRYVPGVMLNRLKYLYRSCTVPLPPVGGADDPPSGATGMQQ